MDAQTSANGKRPRRIDAAEPFTNCPLYCNARARLPYYRASPQTEVHGERAALAQFALHRYAPARTPTDLAADGEAQPEPAVFAAVRLIHGEKARKYLVHVFGRDAYAGIGHDQIFIIEFHRNRAALLVVAHGVADKIAQQLGNALVTALHYYVIFYLIDFRILR